MLLHCETAFSFFSGNFTDQDFPTEGYIASKKQLKKTQEKDQKKLFTYEEYAKVCQSLLGQIYLNFNIKHSLTNKI